MTMITKALVFFSDRSGRDDDANRAGKRYAARSHDDHRDRPSVALSRWLARRGPLTGHDARQGRVWASRQHHHCHSYKVGEQTYTTCR